jgi:hypothetical protein
MRITDTTTFESEQENATTFASRSLNGLLIFLALN